MAEFNTIGLVGRPEHDGVVETLRRLVEFLIARGCKVVLDEQTAELVEEFSLPQCARGDLGDNCDLVIVVGGDGSILSVARSVAPDKVPVIGVNKGRLGFLTDILPEEMEQQLNLVLAGRYIEESRFLLEVETGSGEYLGCALNDVVIHPGIAAQMIEFELFINGNFVYSQASDGLIAATPTGSTAYALSAGGPIMHPSLNAIVLVPMHPHSLSSRPIVVDGDSEITIVIGEKSRIEPQLSCDGEVKFSASPGDKIVLRKQAATLRLIHPMDHSFYQACRSKLGWGNPLVRQDD